MRIKPRKREVEPSPGVARRFRIQLRERQEARIKAKRRWEAKIQPRRRLENGTQPRKPQAGPLTQNPAQEAPRAQSPAGHVAKQNPPEGASLRHKILEGYGGNGLVYAPCRQNWPVRSAPPPVTTKRGLAPKWHFQVKKPIWSDFLAPRNFLENRTPPKGRVHQPAFSARKVEN